MKTTKMFFVVIMLLVFVGCEKKSQEIDQQIFEILQNLETTSVQEFKDLFMTAPEVNDVFSRSTKYGDDFHRQLADIVNFELDDVYESYYYSLIKRAGLLQFKWSEITLDDYVFKVHPDHNLDHYKAVLQYKAEMGPNKKIGGGVIIADLYRHDGEYKLFTLTHHQR